MSVIFIAMTLGDDSFIVRHHTKEDGERLVNYYIDGDSRTSIAVTCECNEFQFKGLLCPHVIKIFVKSNITSLPREYIRNRWRWEAVPFADDTTALGSTEPASLIPAVPVDLGVRMNDYRSHDTAPLIDDTTTLPSIESVPVTQAVRNPAMVPNTGRPKNAQESNLVLRSPWRP